MIFATVFTPVYNRALLIGRVYQSLQRQTFKNFEWIIIDDGSSDDIVEVVSDMQRDNCGFPIKFERKLNGGKHTAHNRAIEIAEGELFTVLDSDDQLSADCLETVYQTWLLIKDNERIVGIWGNDIDMDGNPIGSDFPRDGFVTNAIELRDVYKVKGDKFSIDRLSVLRQYPFPEYKNEKFITEAIVWNRMAIKYDIYCINKPMKIVEYRDDGLSSRSLLLRYNNPQGACVYYHERSMISKALSEKVKNVINYYRFLPGNVKSVINFKYSIFKIVGIILRAIDRILLKDSVGQG